HEPTTFPAEDAAASTVVTVKFVMPPALYFDSICSRMGSQLSAWLAAGASTNNRQVRKGFSMAIYRVAAVALPGNCTHLTWRAKAPMVQCCLAAGAHDER